MPWGLPTCSISGIQPASGNLYDNMVARVNQLIADWQTQLGRTGYVAAFFWMQGESDAKSRLPR